LQPAGEYLGEDYHRAGGVPAVIGELLAADLLPYPNAQTVNGKTILENCGHLRSENSDVIKQVNAPLVQSAGFINLKGNLFDSAIMKTSVISPEFRSRYLSNPDSPNAFEGRAVVFDGPEDFHHTIDDQSLMIDANCVLIMRGAGPIGYPGGAEVVNMRPPSYLITQGITSLPCLGDGRQSGTSGSPSILNASPEAADGGGLGLVQTGDTIRIDLNACTADMLVDPAELERRKAVLGPRPFTPDSQTPWQELFREKVQPFSEGMTLEGAHKYQDIARKHTPRDNH